MSNGTSKGVNPLQSPLVFSAQQLADCLGVSLRHVRRLDSAGKLPKPIRLGRCCRWSVQEMEQFLAAGAPDRKTWQAMKEGPT